MSAKQLRDFSRISKDPILLYLIGHELTRLKGYSNGIASVYLNKFFSAVLQHWELLINSGITNPLYESGLLTIAYRFGQIVITKSTKDDIKVEESETLPNYMFLKSYIPDILPKNLIVYSPEMDRFFFPDIEQTYLDYLITQADFLENDILIAKQLTKFYATNFIPSELYAIATCPNQNNCLNAISSEINLFHHDVNKGIRILETRADLSENERDLSDCFITAFSCAREIPRKIRWYGDILQVKQKLTKNNPLVIENKLLDPLISFLQSDKPTERISSADPISYEMQLAMTIAVNVLQDLRIKNVKPKSFYFTPEKFPLPKDNQQSLPKTNISDIHELYKNQSKSKDLRAAKALIKGIYTLICSDLLSANLPTRFVRGYLLTKEDVEYP